MARTKCTATSWAGLNWPSMTETAGAAPLPLDRLGPWLRAHVPGADGAITAEKFPGGQSNPTYRISVDGAPRFVLRRKPDGVLLPSAHAVEREYRVTRALHGTAVPVAKPLAMCEDSSIVGTPFFVMEYLEGRNFWDATLPDLAPAERAAIYGAMADTLAALHSVDPVAVGLADYGRPGDYFARQTARWTRQYRATETRRIDAIERLIEWLPANNPGSDESRVVHGDFRNDNLIFAPDSARVLAVIDWELSTLGHPLADAAQFALTWRFTPGRYRGLAGLDLAALGIPDEAAFLARYAAASGAGALDPAHWRFALAFACFRNACIRQGVYKRALEGNASSVSAAEHGIRAGFVADLGWRLASGDDAAVLEAD